MTTDVTPLQSNKSSSSNNNNLKSMLNESKTQENLDELLEKYLIKLDEYSTVKEQAGKHFSAGYLELGLANSRSKSRIGKHSYDTRVSTNPAEFQVEVKESDETLIDQENP